jgi:(1->4)-alpha-D-glucan 1-alpha-D-glucosylmutase
MPTPLPLTATYRLQFNKDFTFQDALKILDYLQSLGISHIYASPILRARRGSAHGYDVIDPSQLNPELGTEADFQALHQGLQSRGMGLILDIVPNHMSASSENAWWIDVLEKGPESSYAAYFDIDWHPAVRHLEGKILLPLLGSPFNQVLESQQLTLLFNDGAFSIQYFDSVFPIAAKSYRRILKHRIEPLREELGENSPAYQEYLGIVAAATALSERDPLKSEAVGEKRLQLENVKERLRNLVLQHPLIEASVRRTMEDFAGKRGDPASFSAMERLLDEQNYVLAHWQNVDAEINYRRFFNITDLVGLRMQDPVVFEAVHALVFRLIETGAVNGLRIDHIDGLREPLSYLNRLSERLAAPRPNGAAQNGNTLPPTTAIPIVVEKILEQGEQLPATWPVIGTTGYDYLNALNRFFIDPDGLRRLEDIYTKFLGKKIVPNQLLYEKKRQVMSTVLGIEMRSLGAQLELLALYDRYARDIPREQLTQALIEITAHLGVYRTYIRNLEISAEDAKVIAAALTSARSSPIAAALLTPAAFDFLRDVLLLKNRPHILPVQREARLAFVLRWQQFTGPIMAKAFEDTFLYIYNPLVSLNEVGSDPRPEAAQTPDLVSFLKTRSKHWPNAINATTTHDTKRSEDVRARINVLSEIPGEWQAHLTRWSKWNAPRKKIVRGDIVPDPNEEIFLYQNLLGMWPPPVARASACAPSNPPQNASAKAKNPPAPYIKSVAAGLPHHLSVSASSSQDDAFSQHSPADSKLSNLSSTIHRLQNYVVKATREAMVHTRWTRPNTRHENALKRFVAEILKPSAQNRFPKDFHKFHEKIAYYGMLNALSQALLKVISPGIPDIYQGSDLWDLRLVDPDNRHPVDFALRAAFLADVASLVDRAHPGEGGAGAASLVQNPSNLAAHRASLHNDATQELSFRAKRGTPARTSTPPQSTVSGVIPQPKSGCGITQEIFSAASSGHGFNRATATGHEPAASAVEGYNPALSSLLQNWPDGRPKLRVLWKSLNLRKQNPALFSEGDFTELSITGPRQKNAAAFARHHKKDWAIAIVPRYLAAANYPEPSTDRPEAQLEKFWSTTKLHLPRTAPRTWTNLLTGEQLTGKTNRGSQSILLADLFRHFPVALLTN